MVIPRCVLRTNPPISHTKHKPRNNCTNCLNTLYSFRFSRVLEIGARCQRADRSLPGTPEALVRPRAHDVFEPILSERPGEELKSESRNGVVGKACVTPRYATRKASDTVSQVRFVEDGVVVVEMLEFYNNDIRSWIFKIFI